MHKKKILFVDDERDALLILEKELAARGYSVIFTDNGDDALSLAKSESPDLSILDILMPEMPGQIVNAMLKMDPRTKDIPVVFLTCLLPKKRGVEQGHLILGDVYIAKPYDIGELMTMIEKLLHQERIFVE